MIDKLVNNEYDGDDLSDNCDCKDMYSKGMVLIMMMVTILIAIILMNFMAMSLIAMLLMVVMLMVSRTRLIEVP